ncbi:hypothetical protein E4T39_06136 [Aureobasidium subglaciale]|nr:hypothetical protein E4T39_06136 [Aureobasidium subglaciale]
MASQEALFGRSLLCRSILKFSHSTLPRQAPPSGWNHIQAPDIYALIEQLDHDCIQLRVVQGTHDLECLPLTAIIRETRDLYKRQPNQMTESLPIFGLTKGTALAIRYFCQDNQVRRIQLRFTDDASCDDAVQLLTSHGLMFSIPPTKQSTHSQARATTVNSYTGRQPSVQSARFDRNTSSIIVPTVQETFRPTSVSPERQPSVNRGDLSDMHMFTSSPGPKEYETRNIQRQPTFTPIRTSAESEFRPSTAPIEWPSDMTRKQWPPRREFPFPKPSSSPAKTEMLPPLPKPSYASEAGKPDRMVKEESVSRSSPEKLPLAHSGTTRLATPRGPTRFEPPASRMYNFRQKDDDMAVNSDTTVHDDFRFGSPFNKTADDSRASSSTLVHQLNADVVSVSDQRYRSNASPVQSIGSGAIDKLSSSPERSPHSSIGCMPDSSPSERRSQALAQKHVHEEADMQGIEMTTTGSASQRDAQAELRCFAGLPKEERMEAINQFILASIDNDDFLMLCVDVEACWQRKVLDRRV